MNILLYDPVTGEIIYRVSFSDPSQISNYSNFLKVGDDITETEFDAQPEIFKKVNPLTKTLLDLTPSEIEMKRHSVEITRRSAGRVGRGRP